MELIDELKEDGLDILVIISDWLMPGIKGDELLISVHSKFCSQGKPRKRQLNVPNNMLISIVAYKSWYKEELLETIKQDLKNL